MDVGVARCSISFTDNRRDRDVLLGSLECQDNRRLRCGGIGSIRLPRVPTMQIIDRFKQQVGATPRSVVFAEGEDPRIIAAARQLRDEALAWPILLADPGVARAVAAAAGISIDGLDIRDPQASPRLDEFAEIYSRGRPKANAKVASRAVRRPLFHASLMVKAGDAAAMVAGVSCPTGRVIEAGLLGIGLAVGMQTPSSFFLMVIPDLAGTGPRNLLFADCAVNVDPSAAELADIAIASADSAMRLLGETPRVAMLSFSTRGSARHARVDKIIQALELVRASRPRLAVDGELQLDAALLPRVAAAKVSGLSAVAGQANVLIFPDLDAGNIGYKLTQYMGNALAVGPLLQGFARPVADLSRGASVDDIVATTVLTLAMDPAVNDTSSVALGT